jgi:hypothetical protein
MHFHFNGYTRTQKSNVSFRAKESHNSVVAFGQNKIATMGNCVLVLVLQTGLVAFGDNQGSEDNVDWDGEGFYIMLRVKICKLLMLVILVILKLRSSERDDTGTPTLR